MEIDIFSPESIKDYLQKTSNIDEKIEIIAPKKNRRSQQKPDSSFTQYPMPLSIHCIEKDSLDGLRILVSAGCSTIGLYQAAIFNDKQKIFDFLIQMDINVNGIDENGDSPLLVAVRKRNLYCVKNLLEKGADPSFCDINGYSPAYIASELNEFDILKLLLENQASTTALSFELSPLHIAIKKHHIQIAFLLLQFGASTQLFGENDDKLNYITDTISEKLLDVFKCLMACGMTLPQLDASMLTSDFITVYEGWFVQPAQNDTDAIGFEHQILEINDQYEALVQNIYNYDEKVTDIDFEETLITPIVNQQNKLITEFVNLVRAIHRVSSELHESRLSLIRPQIDAIGVDEKSVLEDFFNIDEHKWYDVLESSKALMLDNAEFFDVSAVNVIEQQLQKFTKLKQEVFQYNGQQDYSNIKTKRAKLANFNILVDKLNHLIRFALESLAVVKPKIVKTLEKALETLKSLRESLIDMRQTSYDIALTENGEENTKKDKVEEICERQCDKLQMDITTIDWQKEQFLALSASLEQCLKMSAH